MSLLDKQSLYDRHTKGNLGNAVAAGFTGDNFASAGVSNADGNYFAECKGAGHNVKFKVNDLSNL